MASNVRSELRAAVTSAIGGDWRAARRSCADLLRRDPTNGVALHVMGAVCSSRGKWDEAAEFIRQAIAVQPRRSPWHRDLAIVHLATGNHADALDALDRCLRLDRNDLKAIALKARTLWDLARLEPALAAYRRWSRIQAREAEPWLGCARCLFELRQFKQALEPARRALRADPHSTLGRQLLAEIYASLYRYEEALEYQQQVSLDFPKDPTAMALTATAYYQIGETDTAVSLFQKIPVARLSPDLHAAYLMVRLHHGGSTSKLLLAAHRQWAEMHARVPNAGPNFVSSDARRRRLSIGYLCAEPITSPAYRFLGPIFRHHDRKRFDVSLYCIHRSVRGRARECGVGKAELKEVPDWPEKKIAEQIRRDRVDILVDISGHFGGGSLLVCAMRAAPVQVSFPLYPATTGIPEMDYLVGDRWTTAPEHENQYSERLYRLKSGYVVFDPPAAAPIGPLPAARTGFLTFGIFQRPAKLNAAVWDAVAAILTEVRNSRLLVQYATADLDSRGSLSRRRIEEALVSRGISPERVRFRGVVPRNAYPQLLATVDIALDSFPYSGQTTTCDCLWMGVPVVTLAGATHASRVSAGLLARVGLDYLVAHDPDEYVRIAVELARDLPALSLLRRGLRRRVRNSTLVDGERITKELEAGYRWMWARRQKPDMRVADYNGLKSRPT